MIKLESMPDEEPSAEEMIRVRQLVDLLNLEMAMQNLDMKPVPCVSQVTIKKTKDVGFFRSVFHHKLIPHSVCSFFFFYSSNTGIFFSFSQTKVVISNPTVFKVLNSDTYVILGNDAQTGNLSSLLQQPMVRKASNDVAESESESDESGSSDDDVDESGSSDDVDESGSSDDVDESGSEEDGENLSWYENLSWSEQEDIKLVTNHTGVSKRKAAKALKEFDGDIVTAIMELNSN
ncbi:PREDICTED: nascent polypeptide-associated complex subunit alpha-like protein 2 isoform X1 [Erythranthe guttata]|uniref:nascent polypeptide-associated complex subunit alpha-like protein 2 isoform X1 n=1 Tax=Erythranthe guttata TaxID=4155 RepID=UPI00064D8D66|nr:PREDICTED: nascent polypeptide-associated complex subunit alpha-like protein 2 isoform X1 [Erythranthe guttata]|eukprot:XP_012839577.1 PREDICTED: nascent polypeptide-associated complex subunit alpha-like protein 2 isoform X1 [Erythranthe guttata]